MSTAELDRIAREADPISDEQKGLVANLVNSDDINFDALLVAGYPEMSKGELSIWLNKHSSQLRTRQAEKVNAFEARVTAARAGQMTDAGKSGQ